MRFRRGGRGAEGSTDPGMEEEAPAPATPTHRRRPLRARVAPDAPTGDSEPEQVDPLAADCDDAGHDDSRRDDADGGNARPPLKQRIRAMLDDQVATPTSREEMEHQAALDLRQSMSPAMQQLVLNVPGSSTAEEAGATLARRAAIELEKPVTVSPDSVVDLRNTPSMGAYPSREKLSNRVLRLADRHWAKGKPRASKEIVAEKSAIAEQEWTHKPAGTQRCFAMQGPQRCRGVFAYLAADRDDGSLVRCPMCQAGHVWDPSRETWSLIDGAELPPTTPRRDALTTAG